MNEVFYTMEYPNGGWKHFRREFSDRREFNQFLKGLRATKSCVGFKATNNRGYVLYK